MSQQDTQTLEETTVSAPSSQQIVKKTTKQVEPQVKGENPQKVYDKKKTILRSNQIVWYILGVIEALLAFRVFLKALGADQSVGFTRLIYSLTTPLAAPFNGIVGVSITGNSIIEWSTLIAAFVYLCIAWGIVYLLDLIYPITPKDV